MRSYISTFKRLTLGKTILRLNILKVLKMLSVLVIKKNRIFNNYYC